MQAVLDRDRLMFDPPEGNCVLCLTGLPGGSGKIYDRSPYGNTGSITGATWKQLPGGLWYLDYDGSDDYTDCGNGSSLGITGAITVIAWVNATAFSGYPVVVFKTTDNSWSAGYGMWWGGDYMRFFINQYGTNQAKISFTATGEWHLFGGTYDRNIAASQLNIYQDDGKVGTPDTCTDPITVGARNLQIGWDAGGSRWHGGIAGVRIYNRALSRLEFQNIYHREKYLFGV